KTGKSKPTPVKFAQGETTSVERDKTSFPDVVSRSESQIPTNIQNVILNHHVQERVTIISTSKKSTKTVHWHIPDTATGSIFFPSCHSASKRVFRKETSHMESSRNSKGEPSRIKHIYADELKNALIVSSEFSKSSSGLSLVSSPKLKKVYSEYPSLPKSRAYTFKQPLISLSTTVPRPVPRNIPVKAERQRPDHIQQNTTVVLNISNFPGTISIPTPVLPRKPPRQSVIETYVAQYENVESVPK
ncbi:hypothetical protein MC885_010497, partial [Smutsia gigantea]